MTMSNSKKVVRKIRSPKAVKVEKPYIEPPVAENATPIQFQSSDLIEGAVEKTRYMMKCPAGEYKSDSWIGLGWAILTHRMWHVWKHGKWMD
jgi:hypothetical protein